MSKYLKTFIIFLLIGLLNTFIFIAYLDRTGMSGGEVGMVPVVVILGSVISLVISFILYYLIKRKREFGLTKAILLYQSVYLLVLIFLGPNPFSQELSSDFQKIYFWIYLISFIICVILISTLFIIKAIGKRQHTTTYKNNA